jgi:hypothetical protein
MPFTSQISEIFILSKKVIICNHANAYNPRSSYQVIYEKCLDIRNFD